jgi:hypothetical protein
MEITLELLFECFKENNTQKKRIKYASFNYSEAYVYLFSENKQHFIFNDFSKLIEIKDAKKYIYQLTVPHFIIRFNKDCPIAFQKYVSFIRLKKLKQYD